jgi:hypothetical protein
MSCFLLLSMSVNAYGGVWIKLHIFLPLREMEVRSHRLGRLLSLSPGK